MGFTDEELSEFKTEAMELLDSAERSLLALDAGEEFQTNYDAVFRTFHSLKGAAGMMELTKLQAHMHLLENLLIQSKDSGSLPKEHIDIFLRGADAARSILNRQEVQFEVESPKLSPPVSESPAPAGSPEIPDSSLKEFVSESREISERVSMNFGLIEKNSAGPDVIDSLYRDIHSLKGSSQLLSYHQMGELTHAMETSLEGARSTKKAPSSALIDALFRCMDVIDRMIDCIEKRQKLEFESDLKTAIPQLMEASSVIDRSEKQVEEPQRDAVPDSAAQSASSPDSESGTIRVSVGLLDRLMTLMGEMVLVRNQVLQYSSRSDDLEFLNLSQRLNVVTGEIQGEMMKTRMQPIGAVISKFNRVVRDLSKELGKKIDLTLEGAETELDKTLLEAVKDPLTHIIRNSCDHGVEGPRDRLVAGKPETGNISVRSFHEGGQVIIEVRDDGKGLNREKLLEKAIEKGLISKEKAATTSERDAFNLIFAPGFSTAAKVTNVSGRGVGMDVVRNNIDRIGGTVELDSITGKGTTIRLKIPLTLAIVPAMIIRCGEDRYAIPQVKLVELVRVESGGTEKKIELIQGKPVYRLRGNLLPLIDLRRVLDFKRTEAEDANVTNIVVLSAETQCFGLIVDEIQDTADIVVKPLSRFLKALSVYSGATVLGDGSIALILDVAGIAQQQRLVSDRKDDSTHQGLSMVDGRLKNKDAQEFLLFRLNSPTKYAVFLGYVHRLEEFKKSSIEYSGSQRIIRYRGSILPIVSLNDYLGLKAHEDRPISDVIPVIVAKKGDHYFGIEVNEILDVLPTLSDIDETLSDRTAVLGGLSTENEVVVVIDPQAVISELPSGKRQSLRQSLTAVPPPQESENVMSQELESITRNSLEAFKSQKRILFVEDTAFFRKHVSSVLKKAGYQVTVVNDGEEALALLDKSQLSDFDLILSDIEMPKVNGIQLAQAIRKSEKWKMAPLIAITTRSESRSIEDGLKAGFDVYLEKMHPPELLEAISSMFSKRRISA